MAHDAADAGVTAPDAEALTAAIVARLRAEGLFPSTAADAPVPGSSPDSAG